MHCQHTQLPDSRFEDVDLARSVFDDVNLQAARFSNANLAGAVFNNLSLADARIDDAKLDGLRIDGVLVTDLQAAWAAQQAAAKLTNKPAAKPAAVIYAKHLATLSQFYQATTGLVLVMAQRADDHVVLASPAFELVLVAMPEAIAATVHIANPPERREDTPIKLVFAVDSLGRVRDLAARLGGELNPPEREWDFGGQRVCDGHDPEGNVLQFRQRIG